MKIVILTTQTIHHTWFVQKLMEVYNSVLCVIETTNIIPRFEVEHSFEYSRVKFELKHFFNNKNVLIKDLCGYLEVENINDVQIKSFLKKVNPDILITFGTRKIEKHLIELYSGRILNLHGGDPELYRGLDSHLWAIYHSDWVALVTTLHMLNEKLDDGMIIQKCSLDLSKISSLIQLRSLNTEACLKLTVTALKSYETFGSYITSQQQRLGRYYSFMPKELKGICVNKFENYIVSRV